MDLKAISSLPVGALQQTLRIMRITAVILFAACIQLSARGLSQTISLSEKNAPLERLFKAIRQQTGYEFVYNTQMLTLAHPVDIQVKDASLHQVLDSCFKDQPFTYTIEERTIIVRLRADPQRFSADSSIHPVAGISGRVTNDKGEPLANANVVVKRTGRGAVTDANGNFTLHNVNSDDIVTVTFIGYKTQNVSLHDRTSLALIMEPATNDLDKVVVQAYGTTSQRLATGNIGVVRSEDIAKQPVMNVLEAIQGQVAGVVVTNNNGYASGSVKVEIRGRNTIGDFPTDPLYIIDGVPLTILDLNNADSYAHGSAGVIQSGINSPAIGQSPFFNINPSDIENITILKDADATAIYGSRGSNGVILITTKKGAPGKTHLDLNILTGVSQVPRYYTMLNTSQYVAMRREALANDGLPVDINNAPDLVAWDTTRSTNWQKYLWGNLGQTTDAEMSLSGGDPRTTFRIAGGYRRQTEILTANGANQRGSLTLNIDHKSLNQRFIISFSGTYTLSSSNMIFLPGSAITLPPNAPPIFDAKGDLNYAGWKPLDYIFPFGNFLAPYDSKTNLLNSNIVLSYELFKGVVAKTNLGYNNIQTTQTFITPIASQDPIINPKGTSTYGYSFIHNLIIEPQLEGSWFLGKGKLTALLGISQQANTTSSAYLVANGFTNDVSLQSTASAPIQHTGNAQSEYRYKAGFGRINYNWRNKFILNLNARRDGSSHFGPGRQFGNFGSVGAGWIFSEENWVKNKLPFLSFGKIRTSYGTTGGDQIGNYQYLSLWSFAQNTYNNLIPIVPNGHTDSTLHWQVNKKTELALELSFFKDRFSLGVSWYRNRCNDQLVAFPTPIFTGFSEVTSNSPADVQNSGWEFNINGTLIDKERIKWSAKFNIGINRNKLLAYPNLSQSPYAGTLVIGKSLDSKRLLNYKGIDPQTGKYTFEDKNHDGQITYDASGKTTDDSYVYDLTPRYEGGLTNTFSYKNLELSVFFYFKKQLGSNIRQSLDAPGDITNQPANVLSRWQKPGDRTNVAPFTTNPYTDNSFINYQFYSNAVYTDASFIRLQNLSISYSLPQKILKKTALRNLKLYLQGQNLFIISSYAGIDPEIQNFTALPLPRIITAGISCSF